MLLERSCSSDNRRSGFQEKSELALGLFQHSPDILLARDRGKSVAELPGYARTIRSLRLVYKHQTGQDYAWTPHPYLSYYPTPNYRKGQTSHNSLGYRNDEFPLEKPDGVYRIVALGGSSTYDVAIEDNAATFTAQLEKLLKEDYGYQNVQVINAGVPGYNSWEILANLEFRVLDLNPDLVIIYEGVNDVHARLVEPSAYRGDDLGRRQAWQAPRVALWEHSALLRILSRMTNSTRQVSVDDFVSSPTYLSWPFDSRLQEDNLDPAEILKENPPIYFRRNLENMIAVAKEHWRADHVFDVGLFTVSS